MVAYIASVPVHLLIALQIIKQLKLEDCDLYYVPTSNNAEELLSAVRSTGIFRDVIMLPNINIEYPITLKQCLKISAYRFGARRKIRQKVYEKVYFNTDGWLLNSIVYSSLINKKAENIFVENGMNPYITSYDTKEWYLRLYINMNFLTCMDGRYIDKRYVFEPSLISVPQSGEICRIDKIDKRDPVLKEEVNSIFGYDSKLDSFSEKKIIIMEQGPRKEPIDMVGLWKRVSKYVNKDNVIVKSHPRQKESILRELGFDMYDRYTIPWEVLTFNQDMSDKTLFCIFSTACVYPKLLFGEEPRIVFLYKLMKNDFNFFGKGIIRFVEGVKEMYIDKRRFFIPETWEELRNYCEDNKLFL